jgi:hypothetical protein
MTSNTQNNITSTIPTLPAFRVKTQTKDGKKVTRDVIKVKIHLPNGNVITADVSQQFASNIIYGRTQSGKTDETVISMVQRMVLDKCTGLYICRDYKSELEEQTDVMREKIQELVGGQIQVVPLTGKTGWDMLSHSMKTQDNTKLYIVMANYTITQKIFSSFSDGDEIRFACALDEADMYVKEGNSRINFDIKLLMSGAIRKYFISATILDITSFINDEEKVTAIPSKFAFKDEIEGDDRVYRSLHGATRYDPLKVGRKVSDAIENGTLTLQRAIKGHWHIEYNRKNIPLTLCHLHSNKNEDNASIAKAISKVVVDEISTPVITFDQTGINVYENGILTRSFAKLKIAMQALKDENKEIVYMMGGQMCSRAFRVTSVDWDMYIGVIIYGWTDRSEASLIVQRMGRLCGLTKKELIFPQRVFATKKTFYKAIDCTNATSELVMTAYENPEEDFGTMKQMVTMPERLTNVKISNSGIENEFTIDGNKEKIHGNVKEEEVGNRPVRQESVFVDRPVRQESAFAATRFMLQNLEIDSMDALVAFRGSASYNRIYDWIENFLGRGLMGTDKNKIRQQIHSQPWYVGTKNSSGAKNTQQSHPSGNDVESSTDVVCCVCLVNKPAIVAQCGHACVCIGCSTTLYSRGNKCPICREFRSTIIKVY